MSVESPDQAVREARQLLGLPATDEGTAFGVRRLDRPGSTYFIVHVLGRVACLDRESGAPMASAETARPLAMLSREAALERAGAGPRATAELVWKPCKASLSMFDPIWEVSEAGRVVYVDQRGKLWEELPAKQPGGGSG